MLKWSIVLNTGFQEEIFCENKRKLHVKYPLPEEANVWEIVFEPGAVGNRGFKFLSEEPGRNVEEEGHEVCIRELCIPCGTCRHICDSSVSP